mgnify:CR=1 FL=1
MSKLIETDTKTFVKFWSIPLIIIIVLFIIDKALTGLIIIGISIFLALALKPLVKKVNGFFTKHFGTEKKHETTSVVFAYIIVVAVIGGILALVGPVVVTETSKFIQQAPEMFEKNFGGWDGVNSFGHSIGIENLQGDIVNAVNDLSQNLMGNLGSNFVASVSSVSDAAMKIMLVLVLTLLFLLAGPMLIDIFWKSISTGEQNKKPITVAQRVLSRMANVISTYVSRQLIVAVLDGVASGLIVLILSLFTPISASLAIPMGMITMVFYMIPMFGQLIGGLLVTLILLFTSPVAGIIFVIVYVVYAQVENNLISPKIQGDALNLPAVAILCAVVIGMYMFGLLGAIIAIPIAGCIRILFDEYPNMKAANRQK